MKKLFLILLAILPFILNACSSEDEDNIAKENSILLDIKISENNEQVILYVYGDKTTIDWGDGKVEDFENINSFEKESPYHYYKEPGAYQIKIKTDHITDFTLDRENSVQDIILGNCPVLEVINLNYLNGIQTLDVKNCPQLQKLILSYMTSLVSLDISKCDKLKLLNCTANRYLSYLDISNNINLETLYCNTNISLNSIKIGNNIELKQVILPSNQLEKDALNKIFTDLPNVSVNEKIINFWGNPGTADCDSKIITDKGWTIKDNIIY
ncbi:MAG: hypothetical protein E6772_07995 [Dysgonomonas sp.]|nr:hypothetical protein [Dysgonomonas sp.]